MAVPLGAVYYDDGEPFVYCCEGGVASKVAVETGIHDDDWMEIQEGLQSDSQVITTWSNELFDGAEVIVLEKTAAEETRTAETEAEVK